MNEILEVVAIAGLFLLRVGAPVLLLVVLGVLIDRWQRNRNAEIQRQYNLGTEDEVLQISEEADAEREEKKRTIA